VCVCCSGGKDSCYNMMQCVSAGHTIVALANLRPPAHGKITIMTFPQTQTLKYLGFSLRISPNTAKCLVIVFTLGYTDHVTLKTGVMMLIIQL